MSQADADFFEVERQRQQVEASLQKLRKALHHWQTWDAEYEALKEEVDAAPDASKAELARIQASFDGELISRREIDDIFGKNASKTKDQITNVLDRRIDYVTKNVETLNKQIEAAESQLTTLEDAGQAEQHEEDEGPPITDIIEELDNDDNVVSYQLNRPGDAMSRVQEALKKTGINDAGDDSEAAPTPKSETESPKTEVKSKLESSQSQAPISKSQVVEQPSQDSPDTSSPTTKGVTFASDTKTEDGPAPQVSRNAQRVEHIMNTAREDEKISNEQPVIPEDEDEDDAELRRMMLQYSMGEVGAVVAELELDEGDSDDDDYDYEFDESDEGFGEEDEEDQYGRSTDRIITPKYQQRMLELEKKLGIKSRFTAQSDPETDGDGDKPDSDDERIGRIVVKHGVEEAAPAPQTGTPKSAMSKSTPTSSIVEKSPGEASVKKGVRFASSLDIAPEKEPTVIPERTPSAKAKEDLVEPLSDIIVERSGPSKPVEAKSSRKPSRFKKSRSEADLPPGPLDMPTRFLDHDRPTAPTGPEGTTLADSLVERETAGKSGRPDEYDDDMIHDAVSDEYHRLRKKFIQREGGFLQEDESPIQPLDEEDGGRERMSRFKAARLSKQ